MPFPSTIEADRTEILPRRESLSARFGRVVTKISDVIRDAVGATLIGGTAFIIGAGEMQAQPESKEKTSQQSKEFQIFSPGDITRLYVKSSNEEFKAELVRYMRMGKAKACDQIFALLYSYPGVLSIELRIACEDALATAAKESPVLTQRFLQSELGMGDCERQKSAVRILLKIGSSNIPASLRILSDTPGVDKKYTENDLCQMRDGNGKYVYGVLMGEPKDKKENEAAIFPQLGKLLENKDLDYTRRRIAIELLLTSDTGVKQLMPFLKNQEKIASAMLFILENELRTAPLGDYLSSEHFRDVHNRLSDCLLVAGQAHSSLLGRERAIQERLDKERFLSNERQETEKKKRRE